MALDVIYVGNAIVDVVVVSDDSFLQEHNVDKGMNLIDEERALYLSERLENPTKMAGGSAANSAVGMALLGGESGFVGEVAEDGLGHEFVSSLEDTGTAFLGKVTNDGLCHSTVYDYCDTRCGALYEHPFGCFHSDNQHILIICHKLMCFIWSAIYLTHQKGQRFLQRWHKLQKRQAQN